MSTWVRNALASGLLFFCLLPDFSGVQAAVVTNNFDDGAGSLRAAIAAASPGETITFNADCAIVLSIDTLVIDKDLTIDGTGHAVSVSGGDSLRVFSISPSRTVHFINLTITNGYEVETSAKGGGIYNQGSITLTGCTVSGNEVRGVNSMPLPCNPDSSTGTGGGIYNDGGYVSLVNSTVSGNTARASAMDTSDCAGGTFPGSASAYGAGIYNDSGTLQLAGSTVSGNSFTGTLTDSGGGGIALYNGTAVFSASTVTGNSAGPGGSGGGIKMTSGTLTVSGSTISNNTITGAGTGGGLYNYAGQVTLKGCTVSGNTSGGAGGGLYSFGSASLVIHNSSIFGNTITSGNGAGVYSGDNDMTRQTTLEIANSLFYGNSAGSSLGGAIANSCSSMLLANSTVYNNTAGAGGGLYNDRVEAAAIQNTIIWGNAGTTDPQINNITNPPDISYSDVEGSGGSGSGWVAATGADGTGNIDSDPLFVNAPAQNFQLQPGSPAIDAGNSSLLPADALDIDDDGDISEAIQTDRGGNPRVSSAALDMGAYEFVPTTSTTTSMPDSTTTSMFDSTTTSMPDATTTTTEPPSTTSTTTTACLAAQALGADNPKLENLRAFRDGSLVQSAIGRRLMKIYYNNSGSMNAVLERSPALQAVVRKVLKVIAPMLGQ